MSHLEFQNHKTDDGLTVTGFLPVGEVSVKYREDLRGCWEVEGTVFATRRLAVEAAETLLEIRRDTLAEPGA